MSEERESRAREMLCELIGASQISDTALRVATDWLKQEARLSTTRPSQPAVAREEVALAISRAVRFTAYNRDDPLALRLEFENDADRLIAAEELDDILSDAFADAHARMAAVLAEAREARGGRPIKVKRREPLSSAADGVAIPAGMKPWAGGDSAPADWDGGELLFRGSKIEVCTGSADPIDWRHCHGTPDFDIIAYTPATPPADVAVREALPKLTRRMIEAACHAHYGTDNAEGVVMTVAGQDYTSADAFRRMWKGVRAALAAGGGR